MDYGATIEVGDVEGSGLVRSPRAYRIQTKPPTLPSFFPLSTFKPTFTFTTVPSSTKCYHRSPTRPLFSHVHKFFFSLAFSSSFFHFTNFASASFKLTSHPLLTSRFNLQKLYFTNFTIHSSYALLQGSLHIRSSRRNSSTLHALHLTPNSHGSPCRPLVDSQRQSASTKTPMSTTSTLHNS